MNYIYFVSFAYYRNRSSKQQKTTNIEHAYDQEIESISDIICIENQIKQSFDFTSVDIISYQLLRTESN